MTTCVLRFGLAMPLAFGCVVRADNEGGSDASSGGTQSTSGTASATDSGSTGGCVGTPIDCYPASNASDCGDASIPGDCVDGTWTCPPNSLPESECDWPSSSTDDGTCFTAEPDCVQLTDSGCSDLTMGANCIQGAWQCPGGYIPLDHCPGESGTGSTGGSSGGSTGSTSSG